MQILPGRSLAVRHRANRPTPLSSSPQPSELSLHYLLPGLNEKTKPLKNTQICLGVCLLLSHPGHVALFISKTSCLSSVLKVFSCYLLEGYFSPISTFSSRSSLEFLILHSMSFHFSFNFSSVGLSVVPSGTILRYVFQFMNSPFGCF